ncbi:MAG TPA: hypothetical protein VK793_03820 [Steroidobacteraceae bacterium]|nr:hypothetical protein [Steroidobacteraceae bacterium]
MGANITAAPSKYIGLINARLLICIPLTFFEDDLFDSRRWLPPRVRSKSQTAFADQLSAIDYTFPPQRRFFGHGGDQG